MVRRVHLQRHHRLWRWPRQPDQQRGAERRRYLAEGQRGGATTRPAAGALPPAPRCLPRAARRRGVCPPLPPPQPDQRLVELQGSPMRPGPLRVLRCGLLLSKPRTSGPWRWHPSSPRRSLPRSGRTRAAPTPSATCRRSASAATPASATPTAPTSAACRPATANAKRAVCSARWRAAAGCCWRTRGTAW